VIVGLWADGPLLVDPPQETMQDKPKLSASGPATFRKVARKCILSTRPI
jgi:hypothetical protein